MKPIYYRCTGCYPSHDFVDFQPVSKVTPVKPWVPCPKCTSVSYRHNRTAKERGFKQIQVSETVHRKLKVHCDAQGITMGQWIASQVGLL